MEMTRDVKSKKVAQLEVRFDGGAACLLKGSYRGFHNNCICFLDVFFIIETF